MSAENEKMGALHGIRVLDLTRYQAGPACTAMLADLGAEVWKIETPGRGDEGRYVFRGQGDDVGAYFLAMNHGKRSVTLDYRRREGRELLMKLVKECDVLVENFRPGTADALEIGYEHCKAVNESIVYASASAFGDQGPMKEMAGFDIHAQAVGGIMSTTGGDDNAYPVGAAIGDQTAGMTLCTAVLGGLFHRERTGRGQKVGVSLYGCQMALQAWEITHYAKSKKLPGKGGTSHPTVSTTGAIWGSYATRDGHITLGVIGAKQQRAFIEALELDVATDSDQFLFDATHLQDQVRARIATRTTDSWIEELSRRDIHVGRVNNYADIIDDPQPWANGYLVEVVHPTGERFTVVGSPLAFSETPAMVRDSAPQLGEHTDVVLDAIGVTATERAHLRDADLI